LDDSAPAVLGAADTPNTAGILGRFTDWLTGFSPLGAIQSLVEAGANYSLIDEKIFNKIEIVQHTFQTQLSILQETIQNQPATTTSTDSLSRLESLTVEQDAHVGGDLDVGQDLTANSVTSAGTTTSVGNINSTSGALQTSGTTRISNSGAGTGNYSDFWHAPGWHGECDSRPSNRRYHQAGLVRKPLQYRKPHRRWCHYRGFNRRRQ
jgi:hypothetical protein